MEPVPNPAGTGVYPVMTKRTIGLLAAAVLLWAAAAAEAQPTSTRSYAVVVGSNPGGPGQDTLKYAERDARNVAAVLRDLGGFAAGDVTLLSSPTPEQLFAAVDRVAARVRRDAASGVQSTVFFYYSGHARASALNLGNRELALAALRDRILALPATLKVVVLDACQSGAFSGVKGIEPAADFSHNSIDRLNAAGVAVMASSSATELSQESDKLGGSYFTHYLLVALRGAGDVDRDGRVSIDEAYRYAYHRTLVATARTAVGRQHVTLETDLKGKGEVALTYPARANARLALPAAMTAEVLIQNREGGAVIAEVHKAAGAMYLALASGSYRMLVVRGAAARQCDLDLAPGRTTTLDDSRCPTVTLRDDASKGGAYLGPRWSLEAAIGGGQSLGSRYVERLGDFGYAEGFDISPRFDFTVLHHWNQRLSFTATLTGIDGATYRRDDDTENAEFQWNTYGVLAGVRTRHAPLALPWLELFANLGVGLGVATNRLQIGERPATRETHYGPVVGLGSGVALTPFTNLGFILRGDYYFAPVMDNQLGDTHDSGGTQIVLGLRGSL